MTSTSLHSFLRRHRFVLLSTLMLALVLCFAIPGHAEEEGGEPGHQRVEAIFKWINFAVVAGVVIWVFGKVLPPAFRGNSERISAEISKATAAKAEADRLLKEAEAKLASLQQEVAALRATAEREAAAEVQRIQDLTVSDSQKISIAARAEIDAAERAARQELKAIAAKLAVDGAESLLAQQLTPQYQETLINNFVASLDRRPN